jgi:GxxExxY protein
MNTNINKEGSIVTTPLLTERIIGAAMKVHNTLGPGFLEKVYENAMVHELRKMGLFVEQQRPIPVYYDGVCVGDYVSDLIVEGKVLLELKAISAFSSEHTPICLNYLHCAKLPVCLLINFGQKRLQVKRLVSDWYNQEDSPI